MSLLTLSFIVAHSHRLGSGYLFEFSLSLIKSFHIVITALAILDNSGNPGESVILFFHFQYFTLESVCPGAPREAERVHSRSSLVVREIWHSLSV